ncbi:uncharacterized protein [Antedon mediterranea]|uniref:uncharacterized protein n=1 Tax=Antedon mediterranea TaxID=105859 RepID=UPI003AF71D25
MIQLPCFLLILTLLGSRPIDGQWNPQCQSNCSWTNVAGEMQNCTQERDDTTDLSVCPDTYNNNNGPGTAPQAENIDVSYYVATYGDRSETFTLLNISFDLNMNGSEIYTGAIIEITELGVTELKCHYLNFNGDVITENDLVTENGIIKRIFFDCTAILVPGNMQYLISIKTLPYTVESEPTFKYYWTPSCVYRRNDFYCQDTHEEDLPGVWTPSEYEVDPSGHKRVELVFNLAPYNFDKYIVYLTEKELVGYVYETISGHLYCLSIYVENFDMTNYTKCLKDEEFQFEVSSWKDKNETFVQVIWTDIPQAFYYVELQPRPTSNGQKCSTNHAVDCTIKRSDVYVKERPCENVPDPCGGDNMLCNVVEDGEPVCSCEDGFEIDNGICSEKLDGEPNDYVIPAVIGSLIGLIAIIIVVWLVCKNKDNDEKTIYDNKGQNEEIYMRRVFLIHSYDHEYHNEVVLKLCVFLKNLCKLNVRTALWSSNEIGIGVNEWMNRECEEADKVIILCSQGTQIKWRAMSRQIEIDVCEDNMGDLFLPFMRLQTPEFLKNSQKFIVSYMSYSSEEHIPQPLRFLPKYRLMDHVEKMFYRVNDLEKYNATQDHYCKALQEWDTYSDAGVELKKAIEEMKKVHSDPDWFFHMNKISADKKRQILAKKTNIDDKPNPDISIISMSDVSPTVDPVSDNEYQMSALNSLRQLTSRSSSSFGEGCPSNDSGVNDISGNLQGTVSIPFSASFYDPSATNV